MTSNQPDFFNLPELASMPDFEFQEASAKERQADTQPYFGNEKKRLEYFHL